MEYLRFYAFCLACLASFMFGVWFSNDDVYGIEHIQNVDEMQPTPDELYFFTSDGKYIFDGEKVECIYKY